MTKGQEQVKEFMEFFGQDCPSKPTEMTLEVAKLRAKLILEEALETIIKGLGLQVRVLKRNYPAAGWFVESELGKNEIGDTEFDFEQESPQDLKELADGLADLGYVGDLGTAVAAGIDLEPVQDEVHDSNMSKAWKQDELSKAPEGSIIQEFKDTKLYRVKRADGKVLKSPSYREANILPIIEAQMNPKEKQPEEAEDIYAGCVSCPNCQQKTFSVEFQYCNSCGAQSYEEPQ